MTTTASKKLALVTGGNRGIGLGIAMALARDGWSLAIAATRSEDECAEPLAMLRSIAPQVVYVTMNIAVAASRGIALDEIATQCGEIDLLVNNAGVAPQQRLDIIETTVESYRRVMEINLEGPFFLTQAVVKKMLARKARTDKTLRPPMVINIGSISATVASTSRGEYCLSKVGVAMASKLWAVRLATEGIDVFEIRPGIIASDMTAAVKEKYDRLIADGLVPQGRWGTPDDIGRVVAMLGRGEVTYATGQVFVLDGGLTLERL